MSSQLPCSPPEGSSVKVRRSRPGKCSDMGAEASKEYPQHELYVNCRQQPDWTETAIVPVDIWRNVCNPAFAIDYFNEWKNRHLKVLKRPWSSFVLQGKNAMSGKEEKLCSFTCKVNETGREEKLKGWLKDCSVLTLHPQVAVIQLVLPRAVKLLVVDWHTNSLLATYTFAFSKEPCVQEVFLSPDASIMLCRQNFWLRRKLNHLSTFDPNIRVIEIKDGLCRRLFVIEDTLLTYGVFASGISMDPRCPSGQVTVVSSTLQMRHVNDQDNINNMQVYNISQCKLIKSVTDSSLDHLIHHIQHSPDGKLLAVVLVNASMYVTCTLRAHQLRLYQSDTMIPLHTMALNDHVTKPHLLSTFPTFSRDVAFIAQATGSSVRVLKLPQRCATLQECCRLVVRRSTVLAAVHKLPLPKAVQAFLDFKPPLEYRAY